MNLAKLHKKILAYLIDLFLTSLLPLAIAVLAYFLVRPIFDLYVYVIFFMALEFIFFTLFNAILLRATNGKTIGGFICSNLLIHNDLVPLTFGDCLVRSVSLSIPVLALINLIYMLCAHQERAIYDQISDTIMVDDTKKKY